MSNRNNFLGLDKFVWWMGVIEGRGEGRGDELGIGRCKVRIFGWHTDDTTALPTKDLPWAQPMYPINNSKKIEYPKEGEWVVGFFMDGESGQYPIMMGIIPGLTPSFGYQNEQQQQADGNGA